MNKNKILKVSIVMGSQSDYKIMKLCEKTLKNLGILFETKIISAHRTPKRMYEYALNAEKNNVVRRGYFIGHRFLVPINLQRVAGNKLWSLLAN